MKNRDYKSKEALIKYLQKDTDERFWQAIANFGKEHGLCEHYLLTTDSIENAESSTDLFFQESDRDFVE